MTPSVFAIFSLFGKLRFTWRIIMNSNPQTISTNIKYIQSKIISHFADISFLTLPTYTLLKPKRHSLRCHDFMVHALLLRMCNNVVEFRVLLCEDCAVANEIDYEIDNAWTNIHGIHDNGPRDHGVWRLTLTAYLRHLHTPHSTNHYEVCYGLIGNYAKLKGEASQSMYADWGEWRMILET